LFANGGKSAHDPSLIPFSFHDRQLDTLMPSAVSAHAVRNPGRQVQLARRRSTGKRSSATKQTAALQKAQSKLRRAEFQDEIDAIFAHREEAVERIAAKYDKTQNVVRAALMSSSQYKATRAPTLRNAVVHQRSLDLHAEGVFFFLLPGSSCEFN
jgi:hypothetical protein